MWNSANDFHIIITLVLLIIHLYVVKNQTMHFNGKKSTPSFSLVVFILRNNIIGGTNMKFYKNRPKFSCPTSDKECLIYSKIKYISKINK